MMRYVQVLSMNVKVDVRLMWYICLNDVRLMWDWCEISDVRMMWDRCENDVRLEYDMLMIYDVRLKWWYDDVMLKMICGD